VNSKTPERKTKVWGIIPNLAAGQLVNFNSIRDMTLGAHAGDVFTVRTDRKIKRKIECNGSGYAIVSEPKVYRGSFRKRRFGLGLLLVYKGQAELFLL